jgi:hypothetical protein
MHVVLRTQAMTLAGFQPAVLNCSMCNNLLAVLQLPDTLRDNELNLAADPPAASVRVEHARAVLSHQLLIQCINVSDRLSSHTENLIHCQ